MDAEALERRLDLLQHQRHRVALQRSEVVDVRAAVTVLRRLLAAPHRVDRGAEPIHLAARVVVVVLALHRVAGELEQARDRVAVRTVSPVRDVERPGRVGRDHLHLHTLAWSAAALP